ncbi:hypothetical protein SAMN02745136_00138 [Anaerocolumna jejuensis DSM 15929]|uniref:Uncharacterized protein n=1 Tax=Anaerocolumna jejuensis DSM 15929 TaxID=1121322 RepID=A0A1M6JMV5_9FIRM|nr:hypothetical protein [Anaerocolumna jejuensis]SHJ47998.1 hypothetical protein SAMN02745136_00138 [Anaerocolumna jejuensis DSM 15929]
MFYIQACKPINNRTVDENDSKLMEAIETIFPMRTEAAIMVWNYVSIPLSYKYDISYMINDIIIVIQELVMKQEGILIINWLPDTFCSQWLIKWKEDIVEIHSRWYCVVGDIIDNLNRVSSISMNKWDFINEWERVFYNIGIALKECGYSHKNIEDIELFNKICSMFSGKGILYQII